MIKAEDTLLTSYVLFGRDHEKFHDLAKVETVELARATIHRRIAAGTLTVPAGAGFEFAGSYANQMRSEKRLAQLIPLPLAGCIYSVVVAISSGDCDRDHLFMGRNGRIWRISVAVAVRATVVPQFLGPGHLDGPSVGR